MLYFQGYGNKDNKQWSRNQIVLSGLKYNANIYKVNETLKKYNANILTTQEMLEYIIKKPINKMTIKSPKPVLSNFGLNQNDINFLKIIKNLYAINSITLLIISWIISIHTNTNALIISLFLFILYGLLGYLYICKNKKYKFILEQLELFNKVDFLYSQKYYSILESIRLAKEAEQHRLEILAKQQKKYWNNILNDKSLSNSEKGQIFEKEMTELFKQLGWNVKLTQASKDGGVDIILNLKGEICIVQCKFHKEKIGVEPVRALWGVREDFKATRVIMLTYSGVTKGGEEFARDKNKNYSNSNWVYKICDINDIIRWYKMVNKGK